MADPTLDILTASSGSTPVAAGGTITFQYPDGRAASTYLGADTSPALGVRANQAVYQPETDFTVSFGAATITVTYLATITIPANVPVSLQLYVRDTSGYPVARDAFSVPVEVQPFGF